MTRRQEPPPGPGRQPPDGYGPSGPYGAHVPTGAPAERPVEHLLRRALDARAAGITVRELRPAQPPGPGVRRLPWAWPRGLALPLAGLAAAAAALVGYAVLAPDAPVRPGPVPVPPAAPPSASPTGPEPTPSPSPSVSPSATPSRIPPPAAPSSSSSSRPTASPSRSPLPGTGTPRPGSSVSPGPSTSLPPPSSSSSPRPPTASQGR